MASQFCRRAAVTLSRAVAECASRPVVRAANVSSLAVAVRHKAWAVWRVGLGSVGVLVGHRFSFVW